MNQSSLQNDELYERQFRIAEIGAAESLTLRHFFKIQKWRTSLYEYQDGKGYSARERAVRRLKGCRNITVVEAKCYGLLALEIETLRIRSPLDAMGGLPTYLAKKLHEFGFEKSQVFAELTVEHWVSTIVEYLNKPLVREKMREMAHEIATVFGDTNGKSASSDSAPIESTAQICNEDTPPITARPKKKQSFFGMVAGLFKFGGRVGKTFQN